MNYRTFYSEGEETMSRQVLEGWATKINDVADHTYVYCPSNGQYFNCWGGHSGPDKRKICSGNGVYAVANCYRIPAFGHPDTAGIGIYAVNGVCHQSANCFLYSTDPKATLTIKVRGYFATVVAYGVWGTGFIFPWLPLVYNPCWQKYKGNNLMDDYAQKLHAMHRDLASDPTTVDANDLLVKETALTAEHYVPSLSAGKFEGLHRDFLKEKDGVIASGLRGEPLADKINALSLEFQKKLAQYLTPEEYRELTGMKPGETVNIVNPEIAAQLKE